MLPGLNLTRYPLAGMIIANGVTDFNFDFFSSLTPYTYAAMAVFPESLLAEYKRLGCYIRNPLIYPEWGPTGECRPIVLEMLKLHNTDIDIYDLLRNPLVPYITEGKTLHLADYLNRLDVRAALHIPDYVPNYPEGA